MWEFRDFRCLKTPNLQPPPSQPWTTDFKTPVRGLDDEEQPPRPVTPNHEVLGSLMDEIDRDLRRQQQQSSQSQSPTSGGGGRKRKSSESPPPLDGGELHTISEYRLLSSAKRTAQPKSISLNYDAADGGGSTSLSALHPLRAQQGTAAPTNEATLKRLQETIEIQQEQICQASRALAFCRQNEAFRGSREEVDAQRALLVATERRRAYCSERERVMARDRSADGGRRERSDVPRGTLSFSYIAVRLSRDFINAYCQQGSGRGVGFGGFRNFIAPSHSRYQPLLLHRPDQTRRDRAAHLPREQ